MKPVLETSKLKKYFQKIHTDASHLLVFRRYSDISISFAYVISQFNPFVCHVPTRIVCLYGCFRTSIVSFRLCLNEFFSVVFFMINEARCFNPQKGEPGDFSWLPYILYGCEIWSLTLGEECRLRVFENRILRRIFGPRMDENGE